MSSEKYKNQNSEVCKNILEKTYFSSWRNVDSNSKIPCQYEEIELIINGKCDQACKYCYLTRFGNELYPLELNDDERISKNCSMLFDWFFNHGLKPNISLFLGEVLNQNIGYEILEKSIDFYIKSGKKGRILIPSNMNFVHIPEYYNSFVRAYNRAKNHDIEIKLSASFDGLYCDSSRPMKSGIIRDEEYYNKIFEFGKKYECGFHPMIHNEAIEHWIDNFLWFQKKFEEYDISWRSMYLLEVRNDGWTPEQTQNYAKFLDFLIDWLKNKLQLSKENFVGYILKESPLNIFSIFTNIGRGISCSIQTVNQLRLVDLTTYACHRLMYKPFALWKFVDNGKEIVDIESLNLELQIGLQASVTKDFPYCEQCFIKALCLGGCLGSQYETTGDMFTPIPSVCSLLHTKVATILDKFKELGLIPILMDRIDVDKKLLIKNYFKIFKE